MKGNRVLGLNARQMLVQLSSLCLALVIFLVGLTAGRGLLSRYYLSEEASEQRQLAYVRDLSSFVAENGLSSRDAEALERWTREKRYVYLVIYRGETPVLETDGYDTVVPSLMNSAEEAENAQSLTGEEDGTEGFARAEDESFRLQFADGVFRVSLVDFSETPYYDLVVILSLALACLALVLVTFFHNRRVTRDIIRLSREVQLVAQGRREAEITSHRQDELGDLARAVEQMRRSIIQRMQNEQAAWAANSSLITAISHDVRTPLTALMGYLDLLEGRQYRSEEQMERYLRASREKAQQLKELTDELFRYFLVFASPEMELHPETYDAPILMEQLLGERVIRLRESGFAVQTVPLQQNCRVSLDVQYLQRVLDNLFSNIEKHADRSARVAVMVRLENGQLLLDLVNGVPARPNAAESTRIGLQTCRKILREMGGSFETRQEDGKFLVELALPAELPENAE